MVPLVFYTMLRRWTTKRVEEKWPHRPLVGDEDTDEEQDDVAHDLREIMVHASSQKHAIEVILLRMPPLARTPNLRKFGEFRRLLGSETCVGRKREPQM